MRDQFRSGLLYTALAQYSTVLVQLIVNMVLARLLVPEQIGTVMVVQVFASFFQLLAGPALSPAIVQNKNLKEKDYGVLLNFSFLLGIIIAIVFGIFGTVALVSIYHNEIYAPISWSMSVFIIVSAVSAVPNGLLYKEKRFKEIGIRLFISYVIGAVLSIVSALHGAGVYSLVILFTIPELVSLVLNLKMAKIRLTGKLDMQPVRYIIPFVKNQAFFSCLNYFYRDLDNLFVGKFLGAAALGYYGKSYQLLSSPVTLLTSVVTPVIQPLLADHETDSGLIRAVYLRMTKVLALIAIPISIFISLNASPIVLLLFGNQWGQAVEPLSFFALSIWAQALTALVSPIWMARNRTDLQSRNGLLSLAVVVIGIISGLVAGSISGVAVGVTIAYVLNFFLSSGMLLKLTLDGKIRDLGRLLFKPLLLGIILYLLLLAIQSYISFSNLFATLLFNAVICVILVLVSWICTGELKRIMQLTRN